MYQLSPDWKATWTAEEAERELLGGKFKFNGPGFYLSDNDTMLVIPHADQRNMKHPWKAKWPKKQAFQFNVWNCNVEYTIFASNQRPPCKSDERTLFKGE